MINDKYSDEKIKWFGGIYQCAQQQLESTNNLPGKSGKPHNK